MKSIQTKFGILITIGLLVMAVLVGGFSIWNTNQIVKNNSDAVISSVCAEQTLRLNHQLQLIEHSVTTVYYYADQELKSMDALEDLEYRAEYISNVENLMLDIGNHTEGVLGIYFRLAPEVVGNGTEGFFWLADEVGGNLHPWEITDLLVYGPDDVAYANWYYLPVAEQKPIWMDPYYNENAGIKMISYVIPMYKEGELLGVLGMDISLSVLVDAAQSVTLYESGRADLIDMNQKLIYYRMNENADSDIVSAQITESLYHDLSLAETNGEDLTIYSTESGKVKMAFQTLRNGMKYILYAPVKEIDAERNQQIIGIVELTVLLLIIFWIFTLYISNRIIRPLKELNLATQRFTQGDWNVEIRCSTNDEVKTLTDSIMKMASQLKKDMDEMNTLAYIDGLTGVKNQAFYMDYVSELQKKMERGETKFAVGVFDVNELKKTNDTFGHEWGDQLIKSASMLICKVFAHSPIFRIGGDEFVAILQNDDYEAKEQLFAQFEEEMKRVVVDSSHDIVLSIAYGVACCTKDMDTYDMVFQAADDAMYEKKNEMKKK